MEFSEEYPNKAPVVKFKSKMFHPNSKQGLDAGNTSPLWTSLLQRWIGDLVRKRQAVE